MLFEHDFTNLITPTKVGAHLSLFSDADRWAPACAGVVLFLA